MALVDLKQDKPDPQEEPEEYEGSRYPSGTCLYLGEDELEKLGVTELPKVGDEYHIHAIGKVKSIRGEPDMVEVQITMMEMQHEDEEKGEDETPESEAAEERQPSTVISNAYRGY